MPQYQHVRKLTERRKAILRFCHEYATTNGWAASHKEIMLGCNLKWRSQLDSDMVALYDMGYIDWKGTRQIKVLYLP